MEDKKIYDVAVLGGGVVGCAIFNKLTRLGRKVVLLEKNSDVATKTSKANSGIIHAGFDAKPNTKKAVLNVRGAKLMPKLCAQLGVELINNGAFVLGNDLEKIKDLYNRGLQNGVDSLYILNREEILQKIPDISDKVEYGLFAENSSIISPYMFTIALAEEAVLNGGDIVFNFDTKVVEFDENVYALSDGEKTVCARKIVLACGSEHNEVAKIFGTQTYDIKYRRGEYYLLDKGSMDLKYTIFPLPDEKSKGVLISPTIHNNIIVGPTSILTDEDVARTTFEGLEEIKDKAGEILTDVNLRKNIRVFSGIRTIVDNDFVIEKDKNNRDVINVTGICSPGLSASPAIAEEVAKLLGLDVAQEKEMIRRKSYPKISSLSIKEKNELIEKDEKYGKIVCRCEMISEAEIINAIHSPLKPRSIDAIKRRTRAGMGRCQGGFCFLKVMEIIARECNMTIDEVTKENLNSRIIVGNIK